MIPVATTLHTSLPTCTHTHALTRPLGNYARIFPSNLRPFPYLICDMQSGPIFHCHPFSYLFAFLNYLTGSNIPYQADRKFTELQTTVHEKNFMAIFTTLSVVIYFSTGTLKIFATLVYVFTIRVAIYDILSMAIIPTLSTSILFCNLCYILL